MLHTCRTCKCQLALAVSITRCSLGTLVFIPGSMLLRRCSLAAMGHSHVSRMPWSKPVGSAQAATAAPGDPSGLQGDSHSRQVAEEVLKEGLPRVPRHLKEGLPMPRHLKASPRLGALDAGAGTAAPPRQICSRTEPPVRLQPGTCAV